MFILKLIVNIVLSIVVIFAIPLFVAAGTLDWWRAWVIVGLVLAASVSAVIVLAHSHRALLEERLKPPIQKGQPLGDKVVLLLLFVAFVGTIFFSALDVSSLHLMGGPGTFLSLCGLVLFVAGWGIAYLALRENSFASIVVRHQEERGHAVVDTGVYSIMRHPMYSGIMLLAVGMPLWLESYAGTLLAAVPVAMIIARVVLEERFLRRELVGYAAYTVRVRWRLIPFLW